MDALDAIKTQLAAAKQKNDGAQTHATAAANHLSGALACLIGSQMHHQRALELLLQMMSEKAVK